jgi:hypothetical protein
LLLKTIEPILLELPPPFIVTLLVTVSVNAPIVS